MDLLDLENGARPWTLTHWQRQTYPPEYQNDFFVCHDGIDLKPLQNPATNPIQAAPRFALGQPLEPAAKLVTFVSTSLDRLRGFDRFHRLARRLLATRRDLLIVALGATRVERPLDLRFHAADYAANLLQKEPIDDPSRYLMPGTVPPHVVAELLRASDLHISPSRPYVVPRSLLEAMAAATPVLAWDTPPAREILRDSENGLLVTSSEHPDDHAFEIATRILDHPQEGARLALAARQTIQDHFNREISMPRIAQFFEQVASRRPGTA
jgi:glycosyltransferase involved in cell wall biosynthesis